MSSCSFSRVKGGCSFTTLSVSLRKPEYESRRSLPEASHTSQRLEMKADTETRRPECTLITKPKCGSHLFSFSSFWSFWCGSALTLSQILPELLRAGEWPDERGLISPWTVSHLSPVNLEDERQILAQKTNSSKLEWQNKTERRKERHERKKERKGEKGKPERGRIATAHMSWASCSFVSPLVGICCFVTIRKWSGALSMGFSVVLWFRIGGENCRFAEDQRALIIVHISGLIDNSSSSAPSASSFRSQTWLVLTSYTDDWPQFFICFPCPGLFRPGILGLSSNSWLWLLIYSLQETERLIFKKALTWGVSCNTCLGTAWVQ